MGWRIEQENGFWLPDLDWRLDARSPAPKSFVSHAHFDHMGDHRTILCSRPTAALIQDRMPGQRDWRIYDFGEPFGLEPGVAACLYPAGHIIGSAMLRLERDGESLLYTGDFKLTQGLSAERCQPVKAQTLVIETTYGLPRYTFPSDEEIMADIVRFCRETLGNGETPVLFGYSLGKSQAILRALADSGLPTMLHPQSFKMTETCRSLGWEFPPYAAFEESAHAGNVIISPPMPKGAAWLNRLTKPKTAIISGWAIDPSAVFRYQCDKAFPMSDHADYLDLLAFVAQVDPQVVYTVHGFAQEFAATLRANGYEAWALGQQNQLSLDIAIPAPTLNHAPATERSADAMPRDAEIPPDRFAALAQLAAELGGTDSSNLKVELLAAHLKQLSAEDAATAALFLTGRPFPQSAPDKLALGWSQVRAAALQAAGASEAEFKLLYQNIRDSSETLAQLLSRNGALPKRSLREMRAFFSALASAPSPAFKHSFLSEEFRKLAAGEAKLLMKIISGDLRIGLKEGLVEEAVAAAFGVERESVRMANLRCGDMTAVVAAAAAGRLAQIAIKVFHPLQFMLASPEANGAAITERLGETVWTEDKFDGVRCQIHKVGEHVELFSRDLNRVTHQFPEIVEAARLIPKDFIGDGEVVAWGEERALPFAALQKRLGRRGEDLFLGEEVPVLLWLYDLLWIDGADLLEVPLENRRAQLETLSLNPKIRLAPVTILRGAAAIEAAFLAARARGNEGLMLKDPRSLYLPGRRGLSWLKLKKAYATIDVVVVAAEYGHGKRKDVLSDYTFAVLDAESGQLKTIGKAYTGLKNAEIERLTEHFLQNVIEDLGNLKRVRPDTVLEIAFDSIRRSARHDSGLALRFPRIKRIRDDKTPAEIDTLEQCRRLAEAIQDGPAAANPTT